MNQLTKYKKLEISGPEQLVCGEYFLFLHNRFYKNIFVAGKFYIARRECLILQIYFNNLKLSKIVYFLKNNARWKAIKSS